MIDFSTESYIHHYKSVDGEELKFEWNFETPPPEEIMYNQKKFYLS